MNTTAQTVEPARPVVRPPFRWPSLPVDPLGVIGLLIVVGLWWAITRFGFASPMFLPPPGGVVSVVAENFFSSQYLLDYHLGDGGLFSDLVYTVSNVLIALVISCVVGVALGLASSRIGLMRAVVDPVMLTAGTIPILVTAPFFLIWFGDSRWAQTALLVIYDITILYLFSQRAADNLDPTYVSASRMLGASPRRIILDVILMGTMPEILGGVRIAMAGAWGLEAFSELLGAPHGIGRVIQAMATAMDTTIMVGTILLLAVVAVGCDAIVAGAFGYITRWKRKARL
jgi:ABC-type nitrate/sulfonate/bicarbonate transport system permease component